MYYNLKFHSMLGGPLFNKYIIRSTIATTCTMCNLPTFKRRLFWLSGQNYTSWFTIVWSFVKREAYVGTFRSNLTKQKQKTQIQNIHQLQLQ